MWVSVLRSKLLQTQRAAEHHSISREGRRKQKWAAVGQLGGEFARGPRHWLCCRSWSEPPSVARVVICNEEAEGRLAKLGGEGRGTQGLARGGGMRHLRSRTYVYVTSQHANKDYQLKEWMDQNAARYLNRKVSQLLTMKKCSRVP